MDGKELLALRRATFDVKNIRNQMLMDHKQSNQDSQDAAAAAPRDWFGYILSAVVGIVITVVATWYQLYVSESQAANAEKERLRSVRQAVILIVEEQALAGKKLELDRISRLIEQKRREQSVELAVSTIDVVQQAEFNIISSAYLPIARKEEVKSIFDSFYQDMASRSFQSFSEATPNAELLNQLAKQIQGGNTKDALSSLVRLNELHTDALGRMAQKSAPTFIEAAIEFFRKPLNLMIFTLLYALLLFVVNRLRHRRSRYIFRL